MVHMNPLSKVAIRKRRRALQKKEKRIGKERMSVDADSLNKDGPNFTFRADLETGLVSNVPIVADGEEL